MFTNLFTHIGPVGASALLTGMLAVPFAIGLGLTLTAAGCSVAHCPLLRPFR